MTPAWHCPECSAIVHYDDYDRALHGAIFLCRNCRRPLVIDHKADRPVLAPTSQDKARKDQP